MAGTISAVGVKAPKSTPKVLKRMEIEPKLGGGHIITHHYSSYQHEPKAHSFGKDDGERAMAHIAKHAGLQIEEQGDSEPQPHWEKES